MTDRIKNQLELLRSGEYKKARRSLDMTIPFDKHTDDYAISVSLLKKMLENEKPHLLFKGDRFGFNRTLTDMPRSLINGEIHHTSDGGNIVINYSRTLAEGMDGILQRIDKKLSEEGYAQNTFLLAAKECVTTVLDFADKYREHAKAAGADELYGALCHVPHGRPQSFYEACVFIKFLQFTLRCNRSNHVTLGGFDKYMLPYFEKDLKSGVSEATLFETLEEFFITLNFDTDLYTGVQQGDNGQSMVLGGCDKDGNDLYNRLSELCLKASDELCIIDPKINLRVDKNTPIERLEFATHLTKRGLGFPQYCNDDVVIPGLIKLGYSPEHAADYAVAACWEFITSGNAFDIPNLGKVNFPNAVLLATKEKLTQCESFDEFLSAVKEKVTELCIESIDAMKDVKIKVGPYISVFIDDCIERGLDRHDGGAIYNNYGAHGVGIANAADAIAAIKKAVFDDRFCSANELITALDADFEGYSRLRNYLLSCPKMGNNDDEADAFASFIMDIFTDTFQKHKNIFGGCFRPGTGSAMEYILSSKDIAATADGRRAGEPFSSSFSPSITARINGPLSCIQSFTKYDLTKIINGGPLTMEIHENTFRNEDGIKKVAALVKAFIDLGGHQLQLNAINRDTLIDAQKNPEAHKNLIVRVWGWSGYFNELDKVYQNHIISRTEFMA